jgi:hypothetical protein
MYVSRDKHTTQLTLQNDAMRTAAEFVLCMY